VRGTEWQRLRQLADGDLPVQAGTEHTQMGPGFKGSRPESATAWERGFALCVSLRWARKASAACSMNIEPIDTCRE
jgi:hypothetical protein